MIPVRLHLTNFLSYGDSGEPIELDGIHVACLCGPNGHGKSALLDAITWALWGQARSNSADDLVRLGQTSMQVELELLLDGQRYRVIRKRTRGKNSQSDLQFQSRAETEDGVGEWRAITGQGVRGTQERINQVMRMDYETFINSAFLLQGRADEFARKTPGDRKRILGEILSLGVYDQLSESARAKRADAVVRVNALEAQLAHMEKEYARLPVWRTLVSQLDGEQTAARLAVETARGELQKILVEKTRLDARRKERDDLARRLQRSEMERAGLRQQLAGAQRKGEVGRALLLRGREIRAKAQELFAGTRERDEQTAKRGELRALEQQANLLERQLQQERHALETRLQLAQQRARELRAKTDQLPTIEKELVDLQRQVEALDRLQEERAGHQTALEKIAGERAQAQGEERRCAEDLERCDERFQLLKAARAVCPLCEGELPEEKRLELGRRLRDEKVELKEAQGKAIQQQADARRAEDEARRALQALEGKLRTGQAMRDRLAQARQKHLQLEEASRALPQEMELVEALAAQLRTGELAPETREAMTALRKQIEALKYDRTRHEEATRRAQQLAGAERDLHALEQAEAQLPEDERLVESVAEAVRSREEAMAEDRIQRAEADKELQAAPAVESEARTVQARLTQAEALDAGIGQRLGAARESLARAEALGVEITSARKERESAAQDQASYEELVKAFGRNGIQALIIENALPEIEAEANALLARMSDGQLAVRLKTQRELRTGAQAETLEIEISDGMGGRKYELYSGGEAFRVNFAIRIALSKLLARRAGARLETLVIDEGFGSQDQDGRQRLVEAIHTIQEDFAKILVITHIDELKDLFPTRIEVTKGASGSRVAGY